MKNPKEKIKIEDISFKYEDGMADEWVINNLNMSIMEGEFVSVVGGSGCGKSTLLSLLAGLKKPTSGSISIDGKLMKGPGLERGVVFQHYSLFPWMSSRDNIVFGISQLKSNQSKSEKQKKAEEYLELVGLGGSGSKYPSQLSGGMQQRVAIARAFAMDSQILLMDEPFSALDAKNKIELQELLLNLWQKKDKNYNGKTIFFVTHDINEAIFLSDRVIIMSNSDHSISAEIEIPFTRPRNRNELMNSSKFINLHSDMMELLYAKIENNEVAL